MEKRILGRTGMAVNPIGFGGIPIQRVNQAEAIEIVRKAIEAGVNFFDSARGYNNSEELLGNALKPYRDQVYIATKTMTRDYAGMQADLELSLKNFQTDTIDLYQFHNIADHQQLNRILAEDGAYRALAEARDAGKIKHIGVSSHSVDLLESVMELGIFDTIQFPYNLIERQGEKVFKMAWERNVGVIAMKPMAGGALENGELSLRFILENPHVTVAIAGMQSLEEVQKNTQVTDSVPLTEADYQEIEKLRATLGTDFCRRCGYCMPCTSGIQIPNVFLFEGYLTRYDLAEWAKGRYEAMAHTASECTECGACEPRCPYQLPIRDKMKKAALLFGK